MNARGGRVSFGRCVTTAIVCMVAIGPTCMSGSADAAGVEPLEVEAFQVQVAGGPGLQAGAHLDVSGVQAFVPSATRGVGGGFLPKADVRDAAVDIPAGLVGNPTAAPTCSKTQLLSLACPVDAQVGTVFLYLKPGLDPEGGELLPLYNLTPSEGVPAELGFELKGVVNIATASLIPSSAPGGYGLQLTFAEASSQVQSILGLRLTIWGVPADPSHDPERFQYLVNKAGKPVPVPGQTSGAPLLPFLRLPTSCGSPLVLTARLDSWQQPGVIVPELGLPPLEAVSEGVVSGCQRLGFAPQMRVRPASRQADSPASYTVELELPQNEAPEGLGTADLREASVTLPQGVSVSPGSAHGLAACAPGEFETGVVHVGLREGVAKGECPEASVVAKVLVKTPLLADPLEGHVYLAQPECDPCSVADAQAGRMIGLDLEANGDGVVVKQKGSVSLNPATGQLTAHFSQIPQLPFSLLRMEFSHGPRAALSNPQGCGSASSDVLLTPWSSPATPAATPSIEPFEVQGCAPGSMPLAPSFTIGATNPQAGRFSPLTAVLTRQDGEQDMAGLQISMPAGLSGMLSNVTLCGEAEAAAGICPASSQIGTATVSAGAGSEPFTLTGNVFITGPYRGQPFGLSVAVPTTAGPFTLAGNTGRGIEVVRASIAVDPHTAALTITSEPLPQVIDGVMVRLRSIEVDVDRNQFTFNPTSCAQKEITGTLTGTQGGVDRLQAPFAAAGCGGLAFKPAFAVQTRAKHSRRAGAYLRVNVTSGSGQANIAKVHVELPKALPSRVETLNQACLQAQFAINPAGCPAGSFVGYAVARSPVLPVPLTGPAIFVSHGGAKFPDLDIVLQGYGVTVELTGQTNINEKTKVTSSSFDTIPDVPVKSFQLTLPTGPHSALAGTGNFCARKLSMPTIITAQDGARMTQVTHVAVIGCAKKKHKRRIGKRHK